MERPSSWDEYEAAVMAGRRAPEPPSDYVMSAAFQAWLVDQLRADVLGQVSGSGLDRMAILRKPLDEPQADDAQNDAD